MIVVIKEDCTTLVGSFLQGEVVSAPVKVAEFLLHNGHADVARNWRRSDETTAPQPVITRFL